MTNQPVTPVTHPDALTIWNEVWPEHRFNQPKGQGAMSNNTMPERITQRDARHRPVEYIRADVAQAQLDAANERIAKLEAIQTVIHRWIDNKDLSLDSGGGMVEILNILYSRSHPTGDLKG